MNIEIIANQFETRAGTLLRYYTGLLESSRKTPFDSKYITIRLIWCMWSWKVTCMVISTSKIVMLEKRLN